MLGITLLSFVCSYEVTYIYIYIYDYIYLYKNNVVKYVTNNCPLDFSGDLMNGETEDVPLWAQLLSCQSSNTWTLTLLLCKHHSLANPSLKKCFHFWNYSSNHHAETKLPHPPTAYWLPLVLFFQSESFPAVNEQIQVVSSGNQLKRSNMLDYSLIRRYTWNILAEDL